MTPAQRDQLVEAVRLLAEALRGVQWTDSTARDQAQRARELLQGVRDAETD